MRTLTRYCNGLTPGHVAYLGMMLTIVAVGAGGLVLIAAQG